MKVSPDRAEQVRLKAARGLTPASRSAARPSGTPSTPNTKPATASLPSVSRPTGILARVMAQSGCLPLFISPAAISPPKAIPASGHGPGLYHLAGSAGQLTSHAASWTAASTSCGLTLSPWLGAFRPDLPSPCPGCATGPDRQGLTRRNRANARRDFRPWRPGVRRDRVALYGWCVRLPVSGRHAFDSALEVRVPDGTGPGGWPSAPVEVHRLGPGTVLDPQAPVRSLGRYSWRWLILAGSTAPGWHGWQCSRWPVRC